MFQQHLDLGPNVTGQANGSNNIFNYGSHAGALYGVGSPSSIILTTPGGNPAYASLGFDASRSNSVYTDTGHVYPLSCALNFIIKC